MNRQTAREQANGVEDGNFEHVFRHRPGQTFADIKDVRDHENREDRAFSDNQ
jgi:hypothetical protein